HHWKRRGRVMQADRPPRRFAVTCGACRTQNPEKPKPTTRAGHNFSAEGEEGADLDNQHHPPKAAPLRKRLERANGETRARADVARPWLSQATPDLCPLTCVAETISPLPLRPMTAPNRRSSCGATQLLAVMFPSEKGANARAGLHGAR